MDREFETLKGELNTKVNNTPANEHVPEIERRNWVTKNMSDQDVTASNSLRYSLIR